MTPKCCPICQRPIVVLDGYASPALVVLVKCEHVTDGTRNPTRVLGCEACFGGKPRATSAPPRRRSRFADAEARPIEKRPIDAPRPDPRPVEQIIADDARAVVGLVSDVGGLLTAARRTWDKWLSG